MLEHLLRQIDYSSEAKVSGYLQVLSASPAVLFRNHEQAVSEEALTVVTAACRSGAKTHTWTEARGCALRALVRCVVSPMGTQPSPLLESLLLLFASRHDDWTVHTVG